MSWQPSPQPSGNSTPKVGYSDSPKHNQEPFASSDRVKWDYDGPQTRRYPPQLSNFAKRFSGGSAENRPTTGRRIEGSTAAPSPPTPASAKPHIQQGKGKMLDIDRTHPRRERTFAGGECVVCEEPLEHTLRGERILQLSCAHVSHEACFYEFIRESDSQCCPSCNAPLGLDSNRGGNVLDIEKLSSIVRSLVVNSDSRQQERSSQTTPVPWDSSHSDRHPAYSSHDHHQHYSQAHQRDPSEPQSHVHARNESNGTGVTSGESGLSMSVRRHPDADGYSINSGSTGSRSHRSKNPIPTPTVTIRSEYPTLNRSPQSQSLTCLVSVEMPEGKWRPDLEDLKSMRPRLSQTLDRNHRHGPSNASNKSTKAPRPPQAQALPEPTESAEELERVTEDLHSRVDNWHGLDFSRFGRLLLHDTVRVGKDRQSWQELECYLFAEMLICVKEKKNPQAQNWDGNSQPAPRPRCVLKGSIMIKKHLNQIETSSEASNILTLNLTVPELPTFHLFFRTQRQLEIWRDAFIALNNNDSMEKASDYEQEISETEEEEDGRGRKHGTNSSSVDSYGAAGSYQTPPTEYSDVRGTQTPKIPMSLHVPVDIVLVIPVSSSMHALKITLLKDVLKFMIQSLGGRDRMGLVTFGSSSGTVPLVGLTNKAWNGWSRVIESIKSAGQKSPRADPLDGASAAMDLLMQRKSGNPLASIVVISDSSASEVENIDHVVSRAEAAKVAIHTFGLGLTHKPDALIELSTRTKAAYTYIKDWMMLRECIAGCLGSLQSICHQNVVLKLKLPEGSPARFVKISGALQITNRASGKDAEAAFGDFRFGEKRDVLVTLGIAPSNPSSEQMPQDAWESIVSSLEELGGPSEHDESRDSTVDEVPIIQASLTYGDVLRDGALQNSPRPSLLAITMLPPAPKSKQTGKSGSPQVPAHPSVVQRRMELLTSDMLSRALSLVAGGKHERAHDLLRETRSVLRGLGKGGLPPVPGKEKARRAVEAESTVSSASGHSPPGSEINERSRRPSPPPSNSGVASSSGIDPAIMAALDGELEAALEWINHPAVFGRDSRKAVLEKIGVISSQRGYTFRTNIESIYASRVPGIRMLYDESRNWPEAINESLTEEPTQ